MTGATRTALVAGATGLVGGFLLEALLSEPAWSTIVALTRGPLDLHHDRLRTVQVDFERLEEATGRLVVNDVFCSLGTTMRQAGSRDAFRRVDLDYVAALARVGRVAGARQFLLVSASSASPISPFFYSRIKAEAERSVMDSGYHRVVILRPGLLLGPRRDNRPGERLAVRVIGTARRVLPRSLAAGLAHHARAVARVMVRLALDGGSGTRIVRARELARLV